MLFSTYDRLFRRLFGDAEAAADLARNALPQELLRRVDFAIAEVLESSCSAIETQYLMVKVIRDDSSNYMWQSVPVTLYNINRRRVLV